MTLMASAFRAPERCTQIAWGQDAIADAAPRPSTEQSRAPEGCTQVDRGKAAKRVQPRFTAPEFPRAPEGCKQSTLPSEGTYATLPA